MDEIDKKILRILKVDARISMRDLGKRVAMSNTAVAERVKKMEDSGIIAGYSVVIDRISLGFPVQTFMMLELTYEMRENPERFLDYIRQNPRVVAAWPIYTSGMDYLLYIACSDTSQLELVIQDMVAFGMSSTHLAGNEVLGLLGYAAKNRDDE